MVKRELKCLVFFSVGLPPVFSIRFYISRAINRGMIRSRCAPPVKESNHVLDLFVPPTVANPPRAALPKRRVICGVANPHRSRCLIGRGRDEELFFCGRKSTSPFAPCPPPSLHHVTINLCRRLPPPLSTTTPRRADEEEENETRVPKRHFERFSQGDERPMPGR